MNDKVFRNLLIEGGLKSAEKYSWDKIAKKVLDFYYEVNPSLS